MRHILIALAVLVSILLVAVLGFKLYDYIGAAHFYNNSEVVFKTPGVNDSNFVPQGMTYDTEKEVFYFTGYMGKPIIGELGEDVAARVYYCDKDGGNLGFARLLNADGTPYTDHTGGIEVFGEYVYITGEDSHGLDVFKLSDVLAGEAKMLGTIRTYNSPAYVYAYEHDGQKYIMAGSYHKDGEKYVTPSHEKFTIPGTDHINPSVMTVFELDETATETWGINPEPVAIISAREMIQGICITESQLVISSSWGLATSNLYFYDLADITCIGEVEYKGTIAYGDLEPDAEKTEEDFGYTVPCYVIDSHDPEATVVAPPMSEELVYLDGRIIVFCESACNKYMFGKLTTGFGTYGYEYLKTITIE